MKNAFNFDKFNLNNRLSLIRVTLSIIVGAHGWARFFSDAITPFGEFLDAQGFPFGLWIAASITAIEIIGSIILLTGNLILPLSLIFSFIYFIGIVLVHWQEGWFVVGLGRNGMEYSVLLIVCFLTLGLHERKSGIEQKTKNDKPT